jgi:hypothetical protein
MQCLLDVVGFDVGKLPKSPGHELNLRVESPYVTRILAFWVAAWLTSLLRPALRMPFSRIALRNANGIKVKNVIVTLREPEQGFVSARQSPGGV